MSDLRVRNRSRLRRKEISDIAQRLLQDYGAPTTFREEDPVEEGETEHGNVLILGDEIVGFVREGRIALSVRGVLRFAPRWKYVTVDMGAVRFVTNGADVMGPGIVDADEGIKKGDFVWVREERHGKPLAVGIAQLTGAELKARPKGKQILSLAYVGDRYWTWGQEDPSAAKSPGAEGES